MPENTPVITPDTRTTTPSVALPKDNLVNHQSIQELTDRTDGSTTRDVLKKLTTYFEPASKITEQANQPLQEIRMERVDRMTFFIDAHIKQILEKADPAKRADLQKRLTEVRHFFLAKNELTQLTPLERVAQIYETLSVPQNPDAKLEFQTALSDHMQELATRAFDQQLDNPEQYVSHGFDHTINVADHVRTMYTNDPHLLEVTAKKYGLSLGEAQFMLENVAIFHDFGYSKLEAQSAKAVHSVAGAEIVYTDKVKKMFGGLITTSSAKKDIMMHDLRDAVLFHGADKVEQKYEAKIQTKEGLFLSLANSQEVVKIISQFSETAFAKEGISPSSLEIHVKNPQTRDKLISLLKEVYAQKHLQIELPTVTVETTTKETGSSDGYAGRKIDLTPGDKLLGLEKVTADASDSPMLFAIRMADNMDMLPNRFSEIQRLSAFREVIRKFGDPRQRESQILRLLESHSVPPEQIIDQINQYLKTTTTLESIPGDEDLIELGGTLEESGAQDEKTPKNRNKTVEEAWKKYLIKKTMRNHPELTPEQQEKLLSIGSAQNTEAFRHFGGCEAIQSVEFVNKDGLPQVRIIVDRQKYDELKDIMVTEKTFDENGNVYPIDVNIAYYQIWRAHEAYKNNTYNGQPVGIVVSDENGNGIIDIRHDRSHERSEERI